MGLGPGRPGLVTAESLAGHREHPGAMVAHRPSPLSPRPCRAPAASTTSTSRRPRSKRCTRALSTPWSSRPRAKARSLYAVPGSPAVAERTVELLRADPRVETVVLPGVSFADLAFERLGVDPLAAGRADGGRSPFRPRGGWFDRAAASRPVRFASGAVRGEAGRSVRCWTRLPPGDEGAQR